MSFDCVDPHHHALLLTDTKEMSASDKLLHEEMAHKRSQVVHLGQTTDCGWALPHPRHGIPDIGTDGERNPVWGDTRHRPSVLALGMMLAISSGKETADPISVAQLKRIFKDADGHVWGRIHWWEPLNGWGGAYRQNPGGDDARENISLSDIPFVTPWMFIHWNMATDSRPVLKKDGRLQRKVLDLAYHDTRLNKPVFKQRLKKPTSSSSSSSSSSSASSSSSSSYTG